MGRDTGARAGTISICALSLLTLGLGLPAGARAEGRQEAERLIDAGSARGHVEFLARDDLEGRAAGTPGNLTAGAYIVRRLASYGLEPLGTGEGEDAWLQPFEREGIRARNIVAVLRGRDAREGGAPEEHVLLGAHYDHVGHGEAGGIPSLGDLLGGALGGKGGGEPTPEEKAARERARIHNGADDNASGTAALLEAAKAFARLDPRPRRSVVFVFFDGEERGLWGSQHYAGAPRLPLAGCKAMINMDMVGRSKGGRVQLIGASSGTGLAEAIVAENAGVGLTLDVDPYMVPNSDHFSFYSRGIPSAFFCTGLHEDYHRPSDDSEKINDRDLARIARLAFRTALRVAEDALTPEFASVPDAPAAALLLEFARGATGLETLEKVQRTAFGDLGGLYVERAEGAGGLLVTYVVPGSRGAEAGVRAGDRLVSLGGKPLAGATARLRLLAASRRATPSALEVVRAGERRTVTLPGR